MAFVYLQCYICRNLPLKNLFIWNKSSLASRISLATPMKITKGSTEKCAGGWEVGEFTALPWMVYGSRVALRTVGKMMLWLVSTSSSLHTASGLRNDSAVLPCAWFWRVWRAVLWLPQLEIQCDTQCLCQHMLKSCKSAIIRKLSWRIGWRKHLHSLSIEDLSKSKVFPNLLWIPRRIYDGHLGLNEKEYTEKEERDNCFCCVNAIKSSKMQHFEVGVLLFPSLILSWYRRIVGSVKCGLHCRKCIYLSLQTRSKQAVWIVSVTPRKKNNFFWKP